MADGTDALKYEAMADMCRHMDAEIKRLLQSVAEKDSIIAAVMQRDAALMSKYAKLQCDYNELLREHVGWMSECDKLQSSLRDAKGLQRCKQLQPLNADAGV